MVGIEYVHVHVLAIDSLTYNSTTMVYVGFVQVQRCNNYNPQHRYICVSSSCNFRGCYVNCNHHTTYHCLPAPCTLITILAKKDWWSLSCPMGNNWGGHGPDFNQWLTVIFPTAPLLSSFHHWVPKDACFWIWYVRFVSGVYAYVCMFICVSQLWEGSGSS